MRFKDFEIVIHGDFESGDDEQDLRSAIAKKLGGLTTKTSNAEAETVEKINTGDARWSPPLQQHLDVLKQSLENTQNPEKTGSEILDMDAAKKYYEKYHESHTVSGKALLEQRLAEQIQMCSQCGNLLLGDIICERLGQRRQQRIEHAWSRLVEHYRGSAETCADQGQQCEPTRHA